MPIFLSEEEFSRCSHDASLVADKADAFIKQLLNQLETVKAEADAASITAEQTCSLLEQKYVSLSGEFSSLQSQHSQLNASLDQRVSELAQLKSQNHQIHLHSIGKDGEIERTSTEASELHKSKRQLMELLEQKDSEISEKNATIKSYLDKIVNIIEHAASKEARLSDLESELARSQASCARLSQEKERLERHNTWLNDELKLKVDGLIELRKSHSEVEAVMSAKLEEAEKRCNETSSSLTWNKDRVKELESKLASIEQELLSSKDSAATAEKQFVAEISTLTKLMELYKESSEEWSKKAGDLEGVIKALETHLNQVESDYKEKLEKEVLARKEIEKEAECLKEKIEKCEVGLESFKKKDELRLLPLSSLTTEAWVESVEASQVVEEDHMLMPSIPIGVSGTALAASLLRDGWSLAKMYTKYQETVDALRHEQLGRKQSQAILERVLYEIEEKAAVILEERVEHERMVEAYSALNQKLQHSLADQTTLQTQIQELKADLKKHERDYDVAQKEILDLQKQVAILLKECRDIQLRCGSFGHDSGDPLMTGPAVSLDAAYDSENVVPEQLVVFKDITGLVEQNVQLRRLVRSLSAEIENRAAELNEKYEKVLQKHTDEAASKVDTILARAEEQRCMIESLHTSVAMYKKLYEEEHRFLSSHSQPHEAATEERRNDIMNLLGSSQEFSRKAQEQAFERVKCLEEELGKSRSEIISIRSERDKLALEAQLAQEKLERYMKEFEHQRDEYNDVRARNVEFSQLIIGYQRQMRESSEALNAAEEVSRKLTMEISLVKQEKDILLNSEKRAADEIRNLSERAHRLQVSLDTIQSTEEVREEARCAERKRQEQYIKQIEREWAEAKKELHEERENTRKLRLERENGTNNALKQVEEMRKELANALHALAAAEARASVAEGRCSDLLEKMKSSQTEASEKDVKGAPTSSSGNEVILEMQVAKEEINKLREEAQVNKEHMLQYKSIAQANEAALKQVEAAHENFKAEAEKVKKSLEAERLSLKEQVNELEVECNLKNMEIASAIAEKGEALAAASSKIETLKEECSIKMSHFAVMETQLSSLKDDLEKERQKSRAAQANYERQVILQSETIQELTRTSQTLATLQEEASELRKLADMLKSENNELKVKLETEKSVHEVLKNDADRKYNEVDELNKILHSQLEALHIKLAEKDRHSSGISGSTSPFDDDDGLQNVVKYLRRSKEIAETEISLLKQEKLRLQSQLETALNAAEAAQASVNAERASSKAFLFTEEEFKSLQLQVREISLLRESNLQLREENKHNFEECQKLRESLQKARVECENLENGLEERQNEVEACKKEIERQKIEKEDLGKRVDELLERCKNFDVEDYNRIQAAVQQMQVSLVEKEAQLEEIKKLCSEKQDVISNLEQDLSRSKKELIERESRMNEILQVEASLKSDLEKQRRLIAQLKKKSENLSKEKDDLSKENQVLSKQLEDARQGKRMAGEAAGEQAMKEKDTRIQILEKTIERLKEDVRKEKDKRLKTQKTVSDSYETVIQQRSKLLDELEKHKQGLKTLTEEVEKLKQGRGDQSQDTTEGQFLSSPLENLASVYLLAVENFGRAAQPVCTEPGSSAADTSSSLDTSSVVATISQGIPAMAPSTLSTSPSPANVPAAKTVEDKGKKFTAAKSSFEARKTGRKLVRPHISKPEDSQGDIDMSEAETQGNLTLQALPPVRKRPPISSTPEFREELLVPGETSSDIAGPTLKKSKISETQPDGGEGQPSETTEGQSAASLEDPEVLATNEESMEDIADLLGGSKEPADADKDEIETAGRLEESTIDLNGPDEHDRSDITDQNKLNEFLIPDDLSKVQAEQDIQQPAPESGSEREEGELVTDIGDLEGAGSLSNTTTGSPEPGELQSEHAVVPANPAGVSEEPLDVAAIEAGQLDSSQVLDDYKTDEGNIPQDIAESSDKLNDNIEQPAVEADEASDASAVQTDKSSSSTAVESGVSRQGGPSVTPDTEEAKQVSPTSGTSTTINLHQRARERAHIRQAGMYSSLTNRGRGRSTRGRGGRGARGQASGKQG